MQTGDAPRNAPLTQGLARNTVFNLLGWIWPIGLSILSVPYTVTKLGNDAFGIFAIVSVVAGYLSLLNGPVAMGNVRYMAEAYARAESSKLEQLMWAGLLVNTALSIAGAVVMYLASDVLARNVFQIPEALVPIAVLSFQWGAISFLLNGMASAVQGITTATRRFDLRNQVGLAVGTLNTVGIVLALWLGWGLLGAVLAQVCSSALALVLYGVVAWFLLRRLPASAQRTRLDRAFVARLMSFSSLLFAGQLISQFGLQIDRALVGMFLGTSAVAVYTVPTKITDRIPGMMAVFSATLYPLSSEAVATGKIDELRRLYRETVRLLLWISAFAALPLLILSGELLSLWIGPEFMAGSWLVLALLAAGVVWRAPGTVAYQVCNGLGRADVNLIASIGTAVCISLPMLVLAPMYGTAGIALGVLIGIFVSNVAYDVFAQRTLLGARSWRDCLAPYGRLILAMVGTFACFQFLPLQAGSWLALSLEAGLIELLYIGLSLVTGALLVRDVNYMVSRLRGRVQRAAPATAQVAHG